MTSWSFHHVDETRAALRTIVQDPAYGATALSNVRIMSEVLPSLLRGARLERSVLVTAAKENLASTMLEHVSAGMDPGLAVRLSAHFLATISPIPIDACYRAAAELALALGLISTDEADALASSAAEYEGPDGVADADQADGEAAPPTPPETIGLTHPPPADDKTTAPWSADAIPSPEEKQEHAGPSAAPDDDTDEWASRGDEHQTGDEQQTGAGKFTPADTRGTGQAGTQPHLQLGGQPVPQQGQSGYGPTAGPPTAQPAYAQPVYAQPIGLAPTPVPGQEAQPAPLAGEWISHVVRDTVHPGLLAFNPPPEMHQGRPDRIEVGVARSPELRDALTSGFRGRGLPEVVHVDAAPLMGVELRGSSFKIEPLSPPEQLVVPLARWEFDVTPLRSGSQTLALCVTIRIDSPFVSGGQIAVPVFERHIRIKVDVVYGTRRFVANNWQWLAGTAVGLGGGIAAWISLVH
jgi:hypothetical protein